VPTRKLLTDNGVKALKPAAPGKRYVVYDTLTPPFGVRVSDKGRKTFIVYRRRAGEPRPFRVKLGNYPLLTLEKARAKAKQALEELASGRDPKEREQKELRDEARRRQHTFGSVAEDFIKRHVAKLRSAKAMEATIRRELLGQKLEDGKWAIDPEKETHWRDRPITEIKRRDVIELSEEIVDRGTRHQARKVLAYVRKLFNWSISRDAYALEGSPCDRVRPKDIVGKLKPRQRVLSDEELRLVWRASFKLGTTEDSQVEAKFPDYPFGPFVRMLMITGQRLREVSDAGKPEIDGRLWTIPPERMKGDVGHEVPLSPMAVELLEALPSFKGEFIFTTTSGKRPISGFSKAKARLDGSIAGLREEDAEGAEVAPMPRWTFHDLRRTVRTRLPALGVPDLICELILAHRRPELHETYDRHKYRDEKRNALERWAVRLRFLVEPPPVNVVSMRSSEQASAQA
jgi:integrase